MICLNERSGHPCPNLIFIDQAGHFGPNFGDVHSKLLLMRLQSRIAWGRWSSSLWFCHFFVATNSIGFQYWHQSHSESVTDLREPLQKTSIWKFKRIQIEVNFCIFVHILLKVVTIFVVACFVGSDNEGTLVAISLAWLRINRRTQQTRERETGEHNKQQRAPITIGNSSLNRDEKSTAQRQTRGRELFLFSCRLPFTIASLSLSFPSMYLNIIIFLLAIWILSWQRAVRAVNYLWSSFHYAFLFSQWKAPTQPECDIQVSILLHFLWDRIRSWKYLIWKKSWIRSRGNMVSEKVSFWYWIQLDSFSKKFADKKVSLLVSFSYIGPRHTLDTTPLFFSPRHRDSWECLHQ